METNEKYPTALPQGTLMAGQYEIESVLGQGGFGITYKAKDHKTGKSVAVKEFFPTSMAARTTATTVSAFSGTCGENFTYGKSCFLQEAETLAQFIGDEHIVRVFSYFEENGTAYFVMEFIEGTSFDHYIRKHGGKLSYEEAEQIMLPVIDALAAVHAKGIIHRDVTPDNIYITEDGTVKLLDFGAARYSLGDQSRSLDVVLKHGYAPKEQYTRHGRQGPFTDVYSVGASFYFAVTGKRPPDSIDRMDEDGLIPPSSLARLAPEKEDAILKAMSVQPSERYQTMAEFHQALTNVTDDRTVILPQAEGQTASQPVPQRIFPGSQPQPQKEFTESQPQQQEVSTKTQQQGVLTNSQQKAAKAEEASTDYTLLLNEASKGDVTDSQPQKKSPWKRFSAKQKAIAVSVAAALALVGIISAVIVNFSSPERGNDLPKDGVPTLSDGNDVASAGNFPSTENKKDPNSGTQPTKDSDVGTLSPTEEQEETDSETEPKTEPATDSNVENLPSTEKQEEQSGSESKTEPPKTEPKTETKTEPPKTEPKTETPKPEPELEISFPLEIIYEHLIFECYSDGTATLTDGDRAKGAVSIPETIKYASKTFRVTRIEAGAFYNCSNLTNIEIPNSVTSIGYRAFDDCSSLKKIVIPENVTSIEWGAFCNCSSLANIKIPKGVTIIEESTFMDCKKLKNVEIPEGVTSIKSWAFSGCSKLTDIEIPEGVTSIELGAFEGCSSLTSITIPEGVTSIEDFMFDGCSSLWYIKIPTSVTRIGDYAFSDCKKLTYIEIPGIITSVGTAPFSGGSRWMTIKYLDISMSRSEFRALF